MKDHGTIENVEYVVYWYVYILARKCLFHLGILA